MKARIEPVKSPAQIDTLRTLFREYERFLQADLCFQGFEAELAGLPGKYAPPEGIMLLAMVGDRTAGCVALRKFADGVCEMKRLYVRPEYLGQGIGRLLAESVIREAVSAGYATMVLDTLERLEPALNLYRALGFKTRAPYYDNPLDGVVYLELDLSDTSG